MEGDVLRLPGEAAEPHGYDLLFDSGCYHGLDDGRRAAYGETVAKLSAPGAALLLFALTPGGAGRPRAFRGASRDEIRARFERDWDLVWQRPHPVPSVFGGAGQFWYLLRKRGRG